MMNGMDKRRLIENTTKSAGLREKGMVKTQLEIMEVPKASLYPHIRSLNFALIVECTRQK